MNLKSWLALLLAGVLVLTLAACKKDGDKDDKEPSSSKEEEVDPNFPVSIGDIRIDKKPTSVVSLSPALTEIICELGGKDRLTGVSDFCDYPDSVSDLPGCGSAATPNWDVLKDLKPQVVFASAALSEADTIRLQQMNAEVVILPRAKEIGGLEEIYVTIGTILDGMIDGEQNGIKTFSPLRSGYAAIEQAAGSVQDPLSGIYLRGTPLTMATGDTFEGDMLAMIGVKNDAEEFTGWDYPADKAVNLYPDVIFYDQSISADYFKGTQIYNTTDAYKAGRLYPVDATAFERQSGRMLDELAKMFQAVYPDIPLDLTERPQPPQEEPEDGETESPSGEEPSSSEDDEDMLDLGDATQIH